ncbi:MAG: hypothetical protein AAB229_04025 [Candidatus Hydrogenedentota bacterium]
MLSIILALSLTGAPKTTMFGDIVVSWRDLAGGDYINLEGDNFRFDQADLGLHHQINDFVVGYTRLSLTGGSVTPNEAWLRLEGMPYEGSFTIGKFFKPLGAPIPLASLSFPAIMLHSYSDFGAKVNFSKDAFSLELGTVNGNPLSAPATGGRVGGTAVITNANPPTTNDIDNNKEMYGRLAVNYGEDWGSLTAGVTYTEGRLASQEIDALNPGGALNFGIFGLPVNVAKRRAHLEFDLDYQKGPFRIFSEYVNAEDGRLRRKIFSLAGSYVFFYTSGAVTTTLGYDNLNINAARPNLNLPYTWNRNRLSASLQWQPYEFLSIQGEYDWNRENAIQRDGGHVDNDGITIQSIIYF